MNGVYTFEHCLSSVGPDTLPQLSPKRWCLWLGKLVVVAGVPLGEPSLRI
jgi:hypothetical protein